MFSILLLVGVALFLVEDGRRSRESLAALEAECEAGEEFISWRMRNQGVYIGLSEEGRALLARWLKAYDWFLKTHRYINGRAHREWIVGLFYDFPPKEPDDQPRHPYRRLFFNSESILQCAHPYRTAHR